MAVMHQLAAKACVALLTVLRDVGSLSPAEAWTRVRERAPEVEHDWVGPGGLTAGALLRVQVNHLVKAGWVYRDDQRWEITSAGRAALRVHPSPQELGSALAEAYDHWVDRQHAYWRAFELAGAIPEGRWAADSDVAAIAEVSARHLTALLEAERPPGWRRVLGSGGRVPNLDTSCFQAWWDELAAEGLRHQNGHFDRVYQLGREDLRQLLAPPETLRRAWLLRSDVAGNNLATLWLADGFCSLHAHLLREMAPGASRAEVHAAVEDDYGEVATYSERTKLTTEVYSFLSQMSPGDLVVTYTDADYHIGTLTADPPWFKPSANSLATLRRRVEWFAGQPIPHDSIPAALFAKMTPPGDLIELPDAVPDLLELVGDREPSAPFTLPDIDQDFARKLYFPAEWLQECVELLRERPQLVFDGPPGTGKTYLARKLAAHLTAGKPQNVTFIQFHANYAYEDFFEGFRPIDDGEGGMRYVKRDGPLRTIVTAARRHPDQVFVLLIDELNRCNLPLVFGELYFLLDYRDESVATQYSPEEPFILPRNLVIIATMNSADRSTRELDAAMRRRFAFKTLHPDERPVCDLLAEWLRAKNLPDEAAIRLEQLNRLIQHRDFKIGPAYLMRESIHNGGLERAWATQIMPALHELHAGDRAALEQYTLSALRQARSS
ncbi:McrB family protein [Nonomuraea soli]|uniref:5-methylcytosine-specific restriction protein B n=1 Tax=Nonomuraea soli TaxID=1032476 RepID=A0A7W0CFU9_9ACTN|nr:AAA family ATPase [Nonomuraea soli]MBA2890427.1 5-methylcytosine-specific restriction protein B [Nonomuraea soli]